MAATDGSSTAFDDATCCSHPPERHQSAAVCNQESPSTGTRHHLRHGFSEAAPTTYSIAPNLKPPSTCKPPSGSSTSSAKDHRLELPTSTPAACTSTYTDNINAFLPCTYESTTGTGTRPNGNNENIYQYQSGGIYHQNQLIINFSVRATQVSLFGFYMLNFAKADTSGVTYFPSNPYDPQRRLRPRQLRYPQPFPASAAICRHPSASPLAPCWSLIPATHSTSPRAGSQRRQPLQRPPGYATTPAPTSIRHHLWHLRPESLADEARFPSTSCNGTSAFSLNMRVSKSFGIGPRVESGIGGGFDGASGGGGRGRPGGGGPPGGGLGPGGLSSSGGGPPHFDQQVARRYSLKFTAMGETSSTT